MTRMTDYQKEAWGVVPEPEWTCWLLFERMNTDESALTIYQCSSICWSRGQLVALPSEYPNIVRSSTQRGEPLPYSTTRNQTVLLTLRETPLGVSKLPLCLQGMEEWRWWFSQP